MPHAPTGPRATPRARLRPAPRARLAAALAAALALGACAGAAPRTDYHHVAPYEAPGASGGVLFPEEGPASRVTLRELTVAPPFDGQEIVLDLGGDRVDFFTHRKWAAPPRDWLRGYLERLLVFEGAAALGDGRAGGRDSLLLTVSVQRLALERSGGGYVARVSMLASLHRGADRAPAWFKAYDAAGASAESDPGRAAAQTRGLLEALGRGLAADLKQVEAKLQSL